MVDLNHRPQIISRRFGTGGFYTHSAKSDTGDASRAIENPLPPSLSPHGEDAIDRSQRHLRSAGAFSKANPSENAVRILIQINLLTRAGVDHDQNDQRTSFGSGRGHVRQDKECDRCIGRQTAKLAGAKTTNARACRLRRVLGPGTWIYHRGIETAGPPRAGRSGSSPAPPRRSSHGRQDDQCGGSGSDAGYAAMLFDMRGEATLQARSRYR